MNQQGAPENAPPEKKEFTATDLFYKCVSIYLFYRAITFLTDGCFYFAIKEYLKGTGDVLASIAVLIPQACFHMYGTTRWFNYAVYFLENNLSRLLFEGSLLAVLVQTRKINDMDNLTYWHTRVEDDKIYFRPENDPDPMSGYINRRTFMKGKIREVDSELYIDYYMEEDQDVSWKCKYNFEDLAWVVHKEDDGGDERDGRDDDDDNKYKDKDTSKSTRSDPCTDNPRESRTLMEQVKEGQVVEYTEESDSPEETKLTEERSAKRVEYEQWVKKNFGAHNLDGSEGASLELDEEKRKVTVIYDHNHEKRDELLDWAKKNMRRMYVDPKSKRFENIQDFYDLLEKSPRDLNKDDKQKDYELSEQYTIQDTADIDFFISHSWQEEPPMRRAKAIALEEFAKEFRERNGRAPTMWFDKTCINPTNQSNSIAVLPINIAVSKKMLIILTESYLTRLWW